MDLIIFYGGSHKAFLDGIALVIPTKPKVVRKIKFVETKWCIELNANELQTSVWT